MSDRINKGASMLEYLKLTEVNDWEGETWHFYIPTKGNDSALSELRGRLDGEEYSLSETVFKEYEVDTLVRDGGDTDYMPAHIKLFGRLATEIDPGSLYKGGIVDHMSPTGDGPS